MYLGLFVILEENLDDSYPKYLGIWEKRCKERIMNNFGSPQRWHQRIKISIISLLIVTYIFVHLANSLVTTKLPLASIQRN